MLLKLFTRIPLQEIQALVDGDIIQAKRKMAFEITKLVHGEEEAIQAQQMAQNLFSQGGDDAPQVEYSKEIVKNGVNICQFLNEIGIAPSKSEARRLIQGGAITIGGNKISDFNSNIDNNTFKDDSVLVKKGKKTFIKVILK